MIEITIDARFLAIGLLVLGGLLIVGAFIALIRSQSALRKKIQSFEDEAERRRYSEGYTNQPSFTRPSDYAVEYERPARRSYSEFDDSKFKEDVPPQSRYQNQQEDYGDFDGKNTAQAEQPASHSEPNWRDFLGEEQDIAKTDDEHEADRFESRSSNKPVFSPSTVKDGIDKMRTKGEASFTAEKASLKQLKQLIKSPITSAEDAAQRKKLFKRYLWILLASTVLFSILMNLKIPVVSSVANIFGLVSILLLFADILLLVVIKKSSKAFNDITCATCKKQIAYGDNVRYTVLDVSRRGSSNERNANLKEYAKVRFDCICQNCGAEKSFTHEFCTDNITASDSGVISHEHPLEKQIEDYFNGHVTVVV